MDSKNLVKLNPDLEYIVTLLIIFAIEGKNDTRPEKSDITVGFVCTTVL